MVQGRRQNLVNSTGSGRRITSGMTVTRLLGGERVRYVKTILCLGVLLIAVIGMVDLPTAWAVEPVNTDTQGLAIEGYDPVAYFDQGKPLKGTEKFTYQWMGAEWRFASAGHLDLFQSNPEKYAPQYGGY
jgi:YHS domain-containing protein